MNRSVCASLTQFAAVLILLPAGALAHGQSATAYHPTAAGRAAEQKGLAAAKRSDFTEARADFLAARDADPYWPENLYFLGVATSKLHGLELSAAAWLEAYLALDPKSPRAAAIRATIDNLVQAGRGHAALLTGAMERMADAFQPDELDARKAHEVLLTDELALLPLAHSDPNAYDMVSNGVYPPLQGDTSKVWSEASWLTNKGVDKDSLAREFASWGRVELSSRILDKGQNGEDWFDFIPELVDGHYLTEMTARTMMRPGDFLPQENIPLQTLCEASIDFAARDFVVNTRYQRQEAMYTIRPCALAVIQASEKDISSNPSGLNPVIADVIEFYLEDGNTKAAWQLYNKMENEDNEFKRYVGILIEAVQDKFDGKPGAAANIESARDGVDTFRAKRPQAAMAAAAAPVAADAYQEQKWQEEDRSWASADLPEDFVGRLGPYQVGPLLSPRQAADLWQAAAQNDLSGDWFEHYDAQLQALRAHTSPNAIDKAGAFFSSSAEAAKVLLDALTEVTAYQRTMVIYRPPAVPLPYTWQPDAAAK